GLSAPPALRPPALRPGPFAEPVARTRPTAAIAPSNGPRSPHRERMGRMAHSRVPPLTTFRRARRITRRVITQLTLREQRRRKPRPPALHSGRRGSTDWTGRSVRVEPQRTRPRAHAIGCRAFHLLGPVPAWTDQGETPHACIIPPTRWRPRARRHRHPH